MRFMFTDKLSKMVTSILRKFIEMIGSDMIFEIEHLFEKTLSVTLNNINNRNEVYY